MNDLEAKRSITAYLGVRGIRTGQIQSERQLKFFLTKMFPLKFSDIENMSMIDLQERIEDHIKDMCSAERAAEAKLGRDKIKALRRGDELVSIAPKFQREYPTLDNHEMTIGEMRVYDRYIKEHTEQAGRKVKKEPVSEKKKVKVTYEKTEKVNEMIPIPEDKQLFKRGDYVGKIGGDYSYEGWVVGAYQKRSGVWRYVVEDTRGLNMIVNGRQIVHREQPDDEEFEQGNP